MVFGTSPSSRKTERSLALASSAMTDSGSLAEARVIGRNQRATRSALVLNG